MTSTPPPPPAPARATVSLPTAIALAAVVGAGAFAAGRAALLVAALTGTPQALLDATEDRLHQGYRSSALPGTTRWVERLRARGLAAVVSGAGPTVLVLGTAPLPEDLVSRAGDEGWRVLDLPIADGASVIES